jgi:hypothetical protein
MPQTLLSLPPAVAAFWRENSGNLPSSFPQALRTPGVFCGNDPEDRKLGSGGGTVNLLHQAWRADNARTPIPFSRWLRADKRLVLHAGGQSRRLPGYAAAGKAFLPLPLREGLPFARFQQTLCDLQVPLYLETLDEAGPGAAVLIASGDVWLDFDSTSIPSLSADFTGVVLAQLDPGEFQRLVQLVQPFELLVQLEQAAIPQAVVAFFLVERLQQGLQLPHRKRTGVHFQVEDASMHRHPHRDLRRRGLQIAERIGQVDFALGHQRRDALFNLNLICKSTNTHCFHILLHYQSDSRS